MIVDGPDQRWVANSMRGRAGVVGYAISRSIDARLTIDALATAIERRRPPGCVHRSDRGSQYAFERCRDTLMVRTLIGDEAARQSVRQR